MQDVRMRFREVRLGPHPALASFLNPSSDTILRSAHNIATKNQENLSGNPATEQVGSSHETATTAALHVPIRLSILRLGPQPAAVRCSNVASVRRGTSECTERGREREGDERQKPWH